MSSKLISSPVTTCNFTVREFNMENCCHYFNCTASNFRGERGMKKNYIFVIVVPYENIMYTVLLKVKGGGPNIFLTIDMLIFAFNVQALQTAQVSMAGRLKFS